MKVLIWFLLFLMFAAFTFLGCALISEAHTSKYTGIQFKLGFLIASFGILIGVGFMWVSVKLIGAYFQ